MSFEMHQMIAVINLIFCGAICWACLCGLNSDVCRQHKTARARYALLMGAALASGLQPALWGEWPSAADAAFAGAVLVGLIINVVRWYGAGKEPT